MNMTQNEKTTLERLFMRGVSVLGMPETLTAENVGDILKAGMDQESKFIEEMMACRTDRAKKAHRVLTAQVYVGAMERGLAERLVSEFENEAQYTAFIQARDALEDSRRNID